MTVQCVRRNQQPSFLRSKPLNPSTCLTITYKHTSEYDLIPRCRIFRRGRHISFEGAACTFKSILYSQKIWAMEISIYGKKKVTEQFWHRNSLRTAQSAQLRWEENIIFYIVKIKEVWFCNKQEAYVGYCSPVLRMAQISGGISNTAGGPQPN